MHGETQKSSTEHNHGLFSQETLQDSAILESFAALHGLERVSGDERLLLFRLAPSIKPQDFLQNALSKGLPLSPIHPQKSTSTEEHAQSENRWFSLALGSPEENAQFLSHLGAVLGHGVDLKKRRKKRLKPALMFQGTCSNAGKSLMAAAFCRVLSDEGVNVAPFKAQNMSLNSYVTADGGEMGRAQILQAMAARAEPDVRMNPLLLKPTGDQGSQVILMGQPLEHLQAREYYQRKAMLKEQVHQAYDDLCQDFDAVVLEGAGSPGEVNLKAHDLVNMSMAAHAQSPVILVGDIDRGGVYASFVGHMAVMAPWEQDLVLGYLVNKFRGDATLLKDAHDFMMQRTGKPVLGVMPWIRNHRLPEEDGVDFEERYGRLDAKGTWKGRVIGVVELPHISNSTDIDPFLNEPDVRMVRLDGPEAYKKAQPGAVIIPGTRNVITDLDHIRKSGLLPLIQEDARQGKLVVAGICGGFQMLGRRIHDPLGLEGAAGSVREGMGLLNMETVLEEKKTLRQTRVKRLKDGQEITGYEIHHGQSVAQEEELFEHKGLGCQKGRVWGSYLHGIFENDPIRADFLDSFSSQNPHSSEKIHPDGVSPDGATHQEPPTTHTTLDDAINAFADVFRRSVNVKTLMKAMGL